MHAIEVIDLTHDPIAGKAAKLREVLRLAEAKFTAIRKLYERETDRERRAAFVPALDVAAAELMEARTTWRLAERALEGRRTK